MYIHRYDESVMTKRSNEVPIVVIRLTNERLTVMIRFSNERQLI